MGDFLRFILKMRFIVVVEGYDGPTTPVVPPKVLVIGE